MSWIYLRAPSQHLKFPRHWCNQHYKRKHVSDLCTFTSLWPTLCSHSYNLFYLFFLSLFISTCQLVQLCLQGLNMIKAWRETCPPSCANCWNIKANKSQITSGDVWRERQEMSERVRLLTVLSWTGKSKFSLCTLSNTEQSAWKC